MDVGGSLLDLACVRIAVIPVGPHLPDHRFEELTAHLTSLREIPVTALPRRAAVPRPTTSATFTAMPAALRPGLMDSTPLPRSRSTLRDFGRVPHATLPSSASPRAIGTAQLATSVHAAHAAHIAARAPIATRAPTTPPVSPRTAPDLNLSGSEVDASFRMRYDVVYRDPSGALIMRPLSDWDDFHSCKIWGVFGIVDCTTAVAVDGPGSMEQLVLEASRDFSTALTQFKDAAIRRLIVFTNPDAQHNAPFVLNDPISFKDFPTATPFSVGYVPERERSDDTRLEVRAQVVHFAGLLLNTLDRECWKRRESPPTELFLSPIDEKHTTDRQSKLAKRRAGRLDKLLGDSLLLMGSPAEALLKYNSAIERSKAGSDRLWLAGAMEGWAAAHVLTSLGSGTAVGDRLLSDRLIEHYSEIYKLYQKKRVVEPEVTAALRLAEYLGRWTNRRREALEAAQHAATVGAELRSQKRAALWEALARFSDRMGCRRKASLYLFRLGQLSANNSVWSSAVALTMASERQLNVKSRKPWASLSRKVLLIAASFAENSGDSSTAAKLFVEALVTSPTLLNGRREADEEILKSLGKAQVPAHLPAASGVLHLEGIRPLHIDGLSIRQREDAEDSRKPEAESKDGPFIYNPFEAKKRAKAAANARRAVTWVCDEPATVQIHLRSNIAAELTADIIAVLLSDRKTELVKLDSSSTQSQDEDDLTAPSSSGDEENASADHAREVRQELEISRILAKSVSESVTLHPEDNKSSNNIKLLTVVPRQTGSLYVRGVLLRMFSGALVMLRHDPDPSTENLPVSVVQSLPRVSISSQSLEGDSFDNISSQTALSVFDGEQRSFHVELKNTGTDRIKTVKTRVTCDEPEILAVKAIDIADDDALKQLEMKGGSKTFTVELIGKHMRRGSPRRSRLSRGTESPAVMASISIIVEYEGTVAAGTIRESTAVIGVICRSAVELGRLTILSNPLNDVSGYMEEGSSHCIALDVSNNFSVPATVSLWQDIQAANRECETGSATWPRGYSSEECLIEHGASARLMCNMRKTTVTQLRNILCSMSNENRESDVAYAEPVFRVTWSLPAMGRQGALDISMADVRRSIVRGSSPTQSSGGAMLAGSCVRYQPVQAEMCVLLKGAKQEDDITKATALRNRVSVGSFSIVTIQVRNVCNIALPERCVLDLELVRKDDRGATRSLHRAFMVGATEQVVVGALKPRTGVFTHQVKVRVASTGCFQLLAYLYDGEKSDTPRSGATHSSAVTPISLDIAKREAHMTSDSPTNGTPSASGRKVSPSSNTQIAKESLDSSAEIQSGQSIQSDASQPLKRVGISKRRALHETGSNEPTNIIYPTTVDSFPDVGSSRLQQSVVLAFASLTFIAVSDPSSVR